MPACPDIIGASRYVHRLLSLNSKPTNKLIVGKSMEMCFLEKITIFFRKILSHSIYFGKNIKSIPAGAFVFFPVQDSQLNCGLTGLVAFKKEEIAAPKIPLQEIESIILHLKRHTYKKIHREKADLTDKYLGGENFLKELHDHVGIVKLTSSLYTIFQEASAREKLKKVSLVLEKIINGEENECHQRLNILSFEENEIIIKRISLPSLCPSLLIGLHY